MNIKKRSDARQYEYDRAYMKMAIAISELSYAKRRKVGAIIVSKYDQVISQGYNGTPNGWDNCCETINPETGELKTMKEVLHAETNAITKCAKFMASTEDATLYVTLSPCFDCAKLIIQAGIRRVVFKDVYRNIDGLKFLGKCGIIVEQINMSDDPEWRFITDINQMEETPYEDNL
ncbi:MAG: dCMP deaminase [Wendovervirus sonii]|uniref:dCMP deaminase n=1 Tax=phage Lak_Megaphage_Sonny TaxID=3109229 RepID=A0ABZ0Z2P3_9CAUD|nr:MAG: dCMP deaminase [phage Lak_Megaphage_Sonny]